MISYKFLLLFLLHVVTDVQGTKENNPKYCRCGEARVGKKVMPRDIQDWQEEEPTTVPNDYGEATKKTLTMKSLDNNKHMPDTGSLESLVRDEKEIREKFAPYIPQLRPWLVIIEVNMTNSSLNTECTGEYLGSDVKVTLDI